MVKTAAVPALLIAAYFVLRAVWAGPLYLGVFAAVPLAAATGILRRSVWHEVVAPKAANFVLGDIGDDSLDNLPPVSAENPLKPGL